MTRRARSHSHKMSSSRDASSRKQVVIILGLLVEQAALSLPNFFYFPFLARVLVQADFAIVALGFTIYLVCISLYDAAFCDPISILKHASAEEDEMHVRSVWTVTAVLVGVSFLCSITLQAFGGFWPRSISLALLILSAAIAIAIPRRIIHRSKLTHISGAAASAYFLTFTLTVAALYAAQAIGPLTAVLPYLTGCIAFLVVSRRLVPALLRDRLPPAALVRSHLRVASGSAVFALFANLTMNIYPPIFALLGDQRAIVSFRLISSTFTPLAQVAAALHGFILPQLDREVPLARIYFLAIVGTIMLPVIAIGISLVWGDELARWAFGAAYQDLGSVMPIAYLGMSISITLAFINLLIRVRQHLMTLQFLGIIQFAATAVFAAPLVRHWGLAGAFFTYSLANCAALVLACTVLAYHRRSKLRDKS